MPNDYDHQIARYRHRFLEKHYGSFELQKPDGYYLVMIARSGSLKMSRMIQDAPFHKSHATRTINRLVALGLVEKTPDPEDLRGFVLNITASGNKIAEAVEKAHQEWQKLVQTPLSKAELETLETIKRKVYEYLQQYFAEED